MTVKSELRQKEEIKQQLNKVFDTKNLNIIRHYLAGWFKLPGLMA